jgi:hypothetical protein
MTTEQTYQVGRVVGLVISIAIDVAFAYYVGKHFHSALVGWTVYFILARLTDIQDNIRQLKRSGK